MWPSKNPAVVARMPALNGAERFELYRVGELVEIVAAGRYRQTGHREFPEHRLAADVVRDTTRRAVFELAVEVQVEVGRLHDAVEIPEAGEAHVRRQLLVLEKTVRPRRVVEAEVHLAESARPALVADLGVEVFTVFLVAADQTPRLRVVAGREAHGVVASVATGRLSATDEALHQAVLPDAPATIHRKGAVVVVGRRHGARALPVHEQPADARPVREIASHPRDGEVVRRGHVLDRLGLHVEESDRGRVVDFARQSGAAENRHRSTVCVDSDVAAEEQLGLAQVAAAGRSLVGDRERSRVLEEERPLLGEEQVEPVQVDLLVVDFHLGKIGVDRGVERQARGDAVLEVGAAGAERDRAAFGSIVAGEDLADHVRRELEVAGESDRWQHAVELPRHRDAIEVVLARQRRPVGRFVAAANVALEVHAPGLLCTVGITNGPERDGELGAPADLGGRRAHLPGAVPVDVEPAAAAAVEPAASASPEQAPAAALVGHLTVVFLARRGRAEHETVLPVAERVEHDLKAVGVVHRRIAAAVADDDGGRVGVVADHSEVDRVVREHDPHLGALGGGTAFVRGALDEAAHRFRGSPRGVAQHVAVERGRLLDPHGVRDLAGGLGGELDTGHGAALRRGASAAGQPQGAEESQDDGPHDRFGVPWAAIRCVSCAQPVEHRRSTLKAKTESVSDR